MWGDICELEFNLFPKQLADWGSDGVLEDRWSMDEIVSRTAPENLLIIIAQN